MSAKTQEPGTTINRDKVAAYVQDLEYTLEVFTDLYSTASSLITRPSAALSHLIACDRYLDDIRGIQEKLKELLGNGGV